MLMDAEFVSFDGLDEEDALERGFSLAELAPPTGSDDTLRPRMVQKLGGSACSGDAPPASSGDSMDLNLTGKHALVCGASAGIGRAHAKATPEEHTSELNTHTRLSYA